MHAKADDGWTDSSHSAADSANAANTTDSAAWVYSSVADADGQCVLWPNGWDSGTDSDGYYADGSRDTGWSFDGCAYADVDSGSECAEHHVHAGAAAILWAVYWNFARHDVLEL